MAIYPHYWKFGRRLFVLNVENVVSSQFFFYLRTFRLLECCDILIKRIAIPDLKWALRSPKVFFFPKNNFVNYAKLQKMMSKYDKISAFGRGYLWPL